MFREEEENEGNIDNYCEATVGMINCKDEQYPRCYKDNTESASSMEPVGKSNTESVDVHVHPRKEDEHTVPPNSHDDHRNVIHKDDIIEGIHRLEGDATILVFLSIVALTTYTAL